jgi:hypothetical protein
MPTRAPSPPERSAGAGEGVLAGTRRRPIGRGRGFLRDNGLTIALLGAFGLSMVGMTMAGWGAHNRDLVDHAAQPVGLRAYLLSGQFLSAVFENWESEFLQMAAYVGLTAVLFQRGSAESRDPDEDGAGTRAGRPRGVGGFLRAYSLGLALAALFVLSFIAHLFGSLRGAHEIAALHGADGVRLAAYLAEPEFWFESFQNWQSEFLSTAALVLLSIWLRFRGSPESKSVDAPNARTGK